MEGLNEMMDFMDAFTLSEKAQQGAQRVRNLSELGLKQCLGGFSITYDVRNMRSPSMQMVTAVAEWGAAPVRQKRRSYLFASLSFPFQRGFEDYSKSLQRIYQKDFKDFQRMGRVEPLVQDHHHRGSQIHLGQGRALDIFPHAPCFLRPFSRRRQVPSSHQDLPHVGSGPTAGHGSIV